MFSKYLLTVVSETYIVLTVVSETFIVLTVVYHTKQNFISGKEYPLARESNNNQLMFFIFSGNIQKFIEMKPQWHKQVQQIFLNLS